MDYEIKDVPVSVVPPHSTKEPLDLDTRGADYLELFKLQSLRNSPYGPLTHEIEPFGAEPGRRWTPLHTWIANPDGSCDPHKMTVFAGQNVNTYGEIAEVFHNDYKLQGSLRTWLSLGGSSADASVFPVTEDGGFPFLERDSLLWRVVTEALSEAMYQCFSHKWLHMWERPVPALQRLSGGVGKRIDPSLVESGAPELYEAIYRDANVANSDMQLSAQYPEGHPDHPSFPAGHATCIGSQITVLRAFFNQNQEAPGADWTVGEELAASARAICLARMIAGIHYRRDMTSGLGLGEAVARKVLAGYDMDPGETWWAEDQAVQAFDLGLWKDAGQ